VRPPLVAAKGRFRALSRKKLKNYRRHLDDFKSNIPPTASLSCCLNFGRWGGQIYRTNEGFYSMATSIANGVRYGGQGLRTHASGSSRSRTRRFESSTRSISTTSSAKRALPFSLNIGSNTAGAVADNNDPSARLRMIMFGRPGAGKGTLSARLVKEFDIVTISTGDLLRQQIAQKTDVGRQAEEIVARGDLLPDELMLKVVSTELESLRDKHWILDGFPRTIGQGQLLDTHLRLQNMPLTLLTLLAVPIELLRARIASRFIHPGSGRVYNLNYNPPRVPGQDDVTGEPLVQRPDDIPEVYERRLRRYDAETAPLLGYYTAQAMREKEQPPGRGLRTVSLAGETSDGIWPELERTVRELFPSVSPRVVKRKQSSVKLNIGGAMDSVADAVKQAAAAGAGPE